MATLEIKMGRVDRTYRPGDRVTGTITLRGAGAGLTHGGLGLHAVGTVRPQLEGRAMGTFDASSSKPISLLDTRIDMAAPGKLPCDVPLPFEFTLAALPGRALTETYHGVYVAVRYGVSATLVRTGFMAKPLEAEADFVVEVPCAERPPPAPVEFEIRPERLENVKASSVTAIPAFTIRGRLNKTNCSLNAPFTGEVTVVDSATPIKSVELQLVRVETITAASGAQVARESTEIQNLQIGEGNVCKNLAIPLYMVFPRVFTCPTSVSDTFRVEFEVRRGAVAHAAAAHPLSYPPPLPSPLSRAFFITGEHHRCFPGGLHGHREPQHTAAQEPRCGAVKGGGSTPRPRAQNS